MIILAAVLSLKNKNGGINLTLGKELFAPSKIVSAHCCQVISGFEDPDHAITAQLTIELLVKQLERDCIVIIFGEMFGYKIVKCVASREDNLNGAYFAISNNDWRYFSKISPKRATGN